MNKYNDILDMCVSTDELRVGRLDKPFIQEGLAFATDAYIIVCMKSDLPDPFEQAENPPKITSGILPCDKNMDKEISVNDLIQRIKNIPKVPEEKDCPNCGGERYQECDLGHTHDCMLCHGVGSIKDENNLVPDYDGTVYISETPFIAHNVKTIVDIAKILKQETITMIYADNKKGGFRIGDVEIFATRKLNPEK